MSYQRKVGDHFFPKLLLQTDFKEPFYWTSYSQVKMTQEKERKLPKKEQYEIML
jgi:hypothetical protein